MCHLFVAYVFCVTAASPRAPLWSAPDHADHTLSEGEAVTLQPPAGVEAGDAYWVEVAGPSILLRRGEIPGPDLTLRPRVRGRYRFACLAGELASLADSPTVDLQVTRPRRPGRKDATACITGPLRSGAGEEVRLHAGLVGLKMRVRAARWKQLSGPKVRLDVTDPPPRAFVRFVPSEPGRYRFAVKAVCDWGRTPWATFTFEVPRRADGSAEHRPLARVTTSGEATVGGEVVLDGSASSDPDGDELTYRWAKLSGPEGRLVGEGPRVRFFPEFAGRYSFELTVVDASGFPSRPEPISFEVAPPPELPAPDPDAPDPLDRPFGCLLEDAPLSALFSALSRRGVTVRTAADLGDPGRLAARRFSLWVVDLPARRVLDWLGRMLGAFYVVEGPGSVWFTRDTKWLEREGRVAETHRIDALYSEVGASDLVKLVRESVRGVLWAGRGASLGEPDLVGGTLTAILPPSAQERVSELLGELRRGVPSGPPAPEKQRALARLAELTTARSVRTGYEDWTLRDVAWDLARQARVTIGFDTTKEAARPKVTLEAGTVTLAEALDALVREAGLAGFVVEPPCAIWLYGQAGEEGARPLVTSQCMWQAAEVRSYDVRMLEALHGFSGPMLVHTVGKRVLPGRWADHFVTVGYSAARERLVVVHHEEVQRAVAALLDRLLVQGQEALEK